MSTAMLGGESGRSDRSQVRAAEQDDRSVWQAARGEHAHVPAGFMQSIAVVEMAGQVEGDLAETLRTLAAQATGVAAARRLRLAEEATRGAQAAARTSERMREHARRWAEHADVVEVHQAVDYAATVLACVARAENEVATVLKALDSRAGPDRAARWQLAAKASVAARHARDLAQALHQLAKPEEARTQPRQAPAADTADHPVLLEASRHQRRAEIDRRLAELRQASPKMPGDGPAPRAAGEAQRDLQEAVAHLLEIRQHVEEAVRGAASAHDRAARALERSADAGISDATEHQRMAAAHRAAAKADRQRAQEIRDQVIEPQPSDSQINAAGPASAPESVSVSRVSCRSVRLSPWPVRAKRPTTNDTTDRCLHSGMLRKRIGLDAEGSDSLRAHRTRAVVNHSSPPWV
jgi:hypothetical protein